MRAALSSTPMARSSGKPPLAAPGGGAAGASRTTCSRVAGMNRRISSATRTPSPATTQSVWRHGKTVSSSETSGGSAALPRSPAKL